MNKLKPYAFTLALGVFALLLMGMSDGTPHAQPGVAPAGAVGGAEGASGPLEGESPAVPPIEFMPPEGGAPVADVPPEDCGRVESWIGKNIKDIKLDAIKTPVRVLYPDSPATMDFSPSRLNIILERGSDTVSELRCG